MKQMQKTKPEPGKTRIVVEGIEPRDKAGWVKAAQRAGLKLREWIIARLNGQL
jgi:hypothetical protein